MFLFKHYHNFLAGLLTSIATTLVLIIGMGYLRNVIGGELGGAILTSAFPLGIGLLATELEKRAFLPVNSYIVIIGKSFYLAGYFGILSLFTDSPWYVAAPVCLVIVFVPFALYPNRFFWTNEAKLASA